MFEKLEKAVKTRFEKKEIPKNLIKIFEESKKSTKICMERKETDQEFEKRIELSTKIRNYIFTPEEQQNEIMIYNKLLIRPSFSRVGVGGFV
jgi:hypothetical protein